MIALVVGVTVMLVPFGLHPETADILKPPGLVATTLTLFAAVLNSKPAGAFNLMVPVRMSPLSASW